MSTPDLDAAAKALYDACPSVKPRWEQLGDVTRSVWRDRVPKANCVPLSEVIAEIERTPEGKAAMDEARQDIKAWSAPKPAGHMDSLF
jgi:hypothetical protein